MNWISTFVRIIAHHCQRTCDWGKNCAATFLNNHLCPKPGLYTAGVEDLRPAWIFDMARIKMLQHRVKKKFHDKQVPVLRQEVKRSGSSS